jgi:hypothetical protein
VFFLCSLSPISPPESTSLRLVESQLTEIPIKDGQIAPRRIISDISN